MYVQCYDSAKTKKEKKVQIKIHSHRLFKKNKWSENAFGSAANPTNRRPQDS